MDLKYAQFDFQLMACIGGNFEKLLLEKIVAVNFTLTDLDIPRNMY